MLGKGIGSEKTRKLNKTFPLIVGRQTHNVRQIPKLVIVRSCFIKCAVLGSQSMMGTQSMKIYVNFAFAGASCTDQPNLTT